VGEFPLTVDFSLRLASAASQVLAPRGGTVIIGKDTRLSGYMFESALEAGFVASGVTVLLAGPLPTPGIAYLARRLKADFGVVISASHNLYQDNGIKFFGGLGDKLSDDLEEAIEARLDDPVTTRESVDLGRAKRLDNARTDYQWFCQSTVPAGTSFEGLKVVIDCAHGAGYKVAPRVLSELGAEIIPIGCSPNGRNINDGCGSTHPELLQTTVRGVGAYVGIALDGDGDRCVLVDETGETIDGDRIIHLLAADALRRGVLSGPVVGTVMSNLGLEQSLKAKGVEFLRAPVGDRNVLNLLKERGGQLGGETSGHIINLAATTTGDGLITALQVLAVMQSSGRSLSELAGTMPAYPQVLVNVRMESRPDVDTDPGIRAAVAAVERELGDNGRVVLRPSGTEPVVRVMVEGREAGQIERLAETIADAVKAAGEKH
jgi:phosphoglucosamine mutase